MNAIFAKWNILSVFFLLAACSGGGDALLEDPRVRAGREMYDRSEYDAAQQHFQELLSDAERDGERLVAAQARKWLGSIFLSYDKAADALTWYRGSLEVLETDISRFDSIGSRIDARYLEERRNVLSNIAVAYKNLQRYDEALRMFREVLVGDRETRDAQRIAVSLYNLADVYHRQSIQSLQARDSVRFIAQHDSALGLLQESLEVYATGDAWLNLGNVHAVGNRLDSAVSAYTRAEHLYAQLGYRVQRALALGNIGVLSVRLDRAAQAVAALRSSIEIIEELRGSISSIDIRSSFISDKFFIYENLIGILVHQGEYAEAFEYVERAKARSFLDLLGNKAIGEGKERTPEVELLIARETELRTRIPALLAVPDSAVRLGQAIREHQRVIAELHVLDPEYASVRSIEPIPLDSLRRLLDDGTGVLEYFVGERSAYGFAITKDTIVVRRIRMEPGFRLDREVEALRRKLFFDFPNMKSSVLREKRLIERLSPRDALGAWYRTETPRDWQNSLVTMYSRFFAPFAGALRDCKQLYIVPHGALHHLPFHALVSPVDFDQRGNVHIVRPRYLIENYAVAYLPSASVLPFALQKQLQPVLSALIVGDPTYADPKYRNRPLNGALIEADSVARFIDQAVVLKREQADEVTVRREIGDKALVHLATHGELNKRDPMQSRILFAASAEDSTANGDLTAEKIFNLDLRALLVTLSACQTAQLAGDEGQFTPGDDLVGLTRAFMYAGTPAVIASLWFVDDAATLAWMRAFYRAWLQEGASRMEASRIAALELLRDPEDPDWIFPYYWSAFVYIGDAR